MDYERQKFYILKGKRTSCSQTSLLVSVNLTDFQRFRFLMCQLSDTLKKEFPCVYLHLILSQYNLCK